MMLARCGDAVRILFDDYEMIMRCFRGEFETISGQLCAPAKGSSKAKLPYISTYKLHIASDPAKGSCTRASANGS